MESHLDSQQVHLSDEQFTELLLGTKAPAVRAHLDVCPQCSKEAERVSAAIGSFQQQTSLWAEQRVATAQPLRAGDSRLVFHWVHRPMAWSAAALVIALTAGVGISRHADRPQPNQQPVAQEQPAVVVTPGTLQSDNQLLSAIDGELRADDSTANAMYGLNVTSHETPTKSVRRLTN